MPSRLFQVAIIACPASAGGADPMPKPVTKKRA
jgi:hypothetical protein